MRIDIHSHFYPTRYLDELSRRDQIPKLVSKPDGKHLVIFPDEKKITGKTHAIRDDYFLIDKKIAYMDSNGIDFSVLSLGNPWIDFMGEKEAVRWAGSLNEEIEEICTSHTRLYGLGVVPLQNIEAACAELWRVKKLSQIKGIMIGTKAGDQELDDPKLYPFWATAAEAEIPVFIHPHYTIGIERMAGFGHAMLFGLGFPFETTLAITRLILGGVVDRNPGLQVILAHAGGTIPYLGGRMDICSGVDEIAGKNLKKPFSEYLETLFYDAVIYESQGLQCVLALVGSHRLLFGTDHPFAIADPKKCFEIIENACLGPEEKKAIVGENALTLFDLPKNP